MRLDPERFAASVVGIVKTAMLGAVQRIEALEKRLESLPVPKDGEPGPVGPTGPQGERGERGADGRDGRDGASVQGIPGEPGAQGEKGADGLNGKDGADGLGFDDFDERLDTDGRTIIRTYRSGERVKEVRHRFAVVLYHGTYDASKSYEQGDSVTWDGSQWIARKATHSIAPGTVPGKDVWDLSVMRGRQGKQGQKGDPGDRGPQGNQGPQGPRGY